MNSDTIGYVWTGEYDLTTLGVDGEIFESGAKKLGFENIRIRVDRAWEARGTFFFLFRVSIGGWSGHACIECFIFVKRCSETFWGNISERANHMRSNHRHKIRFQDIVYFKLNEWRVTISKNINGKNPTWCVKLIRKQEIISFLYRATKCPTEAAS